MNSAQNPTYDAALAAKFASAARHSRLVRILRIAVPVTVAASIAAIVAVSTFLNPFQIPIKLDSGNLVVTGTKITMESPHLVASPRTSGPTSSGPRPRRRTSPIPITSISMICARRC